MLTSQESSLLRLVSRLPYRSLRLYWWFLFVEREIIPLALLPPNRKSVDLQVTFYSCAQAFLLNLQWLIKRCRTFLLKTASTNYRSCIQVNARIKEGSKKWQNQTKGRQEMRSRYVRFQHEVDRIDKSHDLRSQNFGVTIAFLFAVSSAKGINYKCVTICNQLKNLLTQ